MSARRVPSAPPAIAGFDFVELLGSGGFADVFLYQQHLPKRRVAVKVLLTDAVAQGGVQAFTAEANLMAQLSTHPAIVSIYHADVAPDGRPYLVMEYCSKPNLQVRYRKQPLNVAEAIRIGIQVAGAVETAHRAGILHRDIKPANILVTEYGRPALTDFGIAGTAGAASESVGLSIPWSPPEAFASGSPSSPQTDVWALGATIYTLLAGRSPFEVPGARNGGADLMARIQSDPIRPLDRADAPDSLHRFFSIAMAKNPLDRFESALEMARELQKIQVELAMSVTAVDVLDDSAEDDQFDEDDDDGRTRVRSIVTIDPRGITSNPPLADLATTGETPAWTQDYTAPDARRSPVVPAPLEPPASWTFPTARVEAADIGETVVRQSAPDPQVQFAPGPGQTEVAQGVDTTSASAKRSTLPWILAGAGVVIVGAVVGIGAVLSSTDSPTDPVTTPSGNKPVDDVVQPRQVPAPAGLEGTVAEDSVVFTWTNPDPAEGDIYLWGVVVGDEAVALETTPDTTVTVPMGDGDQTCIEVHIRRADGRASAEPAVSCVP
jgi:serine/threonine protein kinase